jgi:hypothetical protein
MCSTCNRNWISACMAFMQIVDAILRSIVQVFPIDTFPEPKMRVHPHIMGYRKEPLFRSLNIGHINKKPTQTAFTYILIHYTNCDLAQCNNPFNPNRAFFCPKRLNLSIFDMKVSSAT